MRLVVIGPLLVALHAEKGVIWMRISIRGLTRDTDRSSPTGRRSRRRIRRGESRRLSNTSNTEKMQDSIGNQSFLD